MVKFNQVHKNRIVLCVVDNRDLYQTGWATEISTNITDFMLHRFTMRDYDIYIGKDEDRLLREASDDGFYSHAVVIAMGMSLGLSDRLFSAMDNLCKQDFFLAGHILDRNENSYWKNGYYELHHQFYIVQLADYKELGGPFAGQQENVKHTQVEPVRSTECLYNDHEVAAWIKPGSTNKEYDMKCHGWNIISIALQHNKTIIDLGNDIRNNKKYFYYEHDHVFLRLIGDIYQNQFFCNNFVSSWNSDQFKEHIPFEGPVEQYITVGTGVYWITYLERLGTTLDTEVIFTDINHNCLKFMEAMVTEWDGKDYHEFYKTRMPWLPNNTTQDANAYLEYTKNEWEKFIDNQPDWLNVWSKIKQLKFKFILIDYMASYNLNWITPGKRTLVNLSDVFTHSPYIATQSLKYRVSCENKLFNGLKKVDPNIHIMMTSRAADGFRSNSRTLSGPVTNFELTDINELKKPQWRLVDWTSPRPLG
jgi:hypothetical protein